MTAFILSFFITTTPPPPQPPQGWLDCSFDIRNVYRCKP
jgi:hypothetical protein